MNEEHDPQGLDPHTPGAKLDYGKNRLGLVLGDFARALWKVGEVGTLGASKYSPKGWLSVPNAEARYADALYRHLLQSHSTELDPTGLSHLAHAAWNLLALIELKARHEKAETDE